MGERPPLVVERARDDEVNQAQALRGRRVVELAGRDGQERATSPHQLGEAFRAAPKPA